MDLFFVALFAVLAGAGIWGGVMTAVMWRARMYPLAVAWAFAPLMAALGMLVLAGTLWEKKKPAPKKI